MCIACEMGFWIAIAEPPPGARVAPEEPATPFVCDAPQDEAQAVAPPPPDERKSHVINP